MSKKDCYAWATLQVKVFVDEDDVAQKILELNPDISEENPFADATLQQEQEAFRDAAHERINALISSDDPIKLYDIEIDLSSYKH